MATIKPRRGTTAPTTGLVQNELAVDTTNKRIYIGAADGSGTLIGAAPGGSDTQVQFNDGGNLGGDSGLTYNKTTDSLTITGDLAVNGGDITTTSATATLFNTNATTLSIGGAATTFNVGYSGSSTHTINIGTTGLGTSQVKTINLGTGSGNATKTANINIGSSGGATYLNSPFVYIGDNSGSAPSTLAVDTINPYTSLGVLTISSAANTLYVDSTSDVLIGDTQGGGNGTLLSIVDATSYMSALAPSGFRLTNQTELRFYENSLNGTNYVGFKAPATLSADRIWTLPSADGTNGQVLTTNGSGTLSWSSAGGGSGTVTSITPAADTGTGTAITTSGTITISGTANEIETSVSGTTVTIGLPDLVATSAVGGILSLINQGIV